MTERNRHLLIGFGLMFGLQLIVAWIARAWFGIVGGANDIVGIMLIFTVAIYFGGGMVMGLLAEKRAWYEPLAVASISVILNALLYLVGAAPDLTFISAVGNSSSPVILLLVNFGSMLASSLGGYYIGQRIHHRPNELEEVSISPERRKAIEQRKEEIALQR
jgi:hypothetical protein